MIMARRGEVDLMVSVLPCVQRDRLPAVTLSTAWSPPASLSALIIVCCEEGNGKPHKSSYPERRKPVGTALEAEDTLSLIAVSSVAKNDAVK